MMSPNRGERGLRESGWDLFAFARVISTQRRLRREEGRVERRVIELTRRGWKEENDNERQRELISGRRFSIGRRGRLLVHRGSCGWLLRQEDGLAKKLNWNYADILVSRFKFLVSLDSETHIHLYEI